MPRWQPAERDARYRRALNAGLPPVVTEGDSWFDYPMYENLIDRIDDANRFALKRLERTGDTVHGMIGTPPADWPGLESLRTIIEHEQPQFILFSGGGNDVLEDGVCETLFVTYDPANPTRPAAEYFGPNWTALLGRIEAAYTQLVRTVGHIAPIFVHGYDYMVPSRKPVHYDGVAITGPWLIRALEDTHHIPDPGVRRAIAHELITQFNAMLDRLEAAHVPNFAHIDLRGTLAEDDWQNEIHPTEQGFTNLAAKYLDQLDEKLEPILANREALGLTVNA